jgi:hypothetical protein
MKYTRIQKKQVYCGSRFWAGSASGSVHILFQIRLGNGVITLLNHELGSYFEKENTMSAITNQRYKQRWGKITTFALVLSCVLMASACDTEKVSGDFSILSRPTLIVVETVGTIDVTAQCLPGEQLVGGGYELGQPVLNQDPAGNVLIVEASYPSAADTWTVTLFNPDTDANGANQGTLIRVDAYCISKTSLPVGMQIVSSQAVTVDFDRETKITANCPNGSAVMGGGFKTNHTRPYAGSYNAWLLASAPTLDATQTATGWSVRQEVISWPPPPSPPTTTVYALCATQNLTAGSPSQSDVPPVDEFGFGFYEGQTSCDEGEFTAGGGYEFLGDPLIPHAIYNHSVANEFSGWEVNGFYGFQTGTTSDVKGWATCIKLPPINLAVKITSPVDGSSFPGVPGTGQTDPITFTAIATDGSGAPATGVTFQWTDNGTSFGTTGATFSASLTAANCEDIHHKITVTATDSAGHSASDAILVSVYAQQIC